MKLETIVVATDFSEQSDVAFRQAIGVAKRQGATIAIVHVDPTATPQPSHLPITQRAAEEVDKVTEELRERSQQDLDALAERAREAGLDVTTMLVHGHADEAIVSAAEELGADLIATGTHGRTGLARFLLGSVAERVVRLSHTNVMVSRGGQEARGDFGRILVPTDFSDASEKALRLALQLASPNAEIDLYHAWQYPAGTHRISSDDPEGPMAGVKSEIVRHNLELAEKWVETHAAGEITVHFHQDHGPASELIIDRLEKKAYDLVAMGTHGRRGFRRFILGSVAENTVRHAPCAVVVAHAGDAD